jgi:hypothetical protein
MHNNVMPMKGDVHSKCCACHCKWSRSMAHPVSIYASWLMIYRREWIHPWKWSTSAVFQWMFHNRHRMCGTSTLLKFPSDCCLQPQN